MSLSKKYSYRDRCINKCLLGWVCVWKVRAKQLKQFHGKNNLIIKKSVWNFLANFHSQFSKNKSQFANCEDLFCTLHLKLWKWFWKLVLTSCKHADGDKEGCIVFSCCGWAKDHSKTSAMAQSMDKFTFVSLYNSENSIEL